MTKRTFIVNSFRKVKFINKFENVSNIIVNSNEAIQDIDKRINDIADKAKFMPVTQRELINYKRKFDLSNNIYTYLLQKRSEAQITMASNMPDNEVIDVARTEFDNQVFPKKGLNYLIALILGMIFPIIYVLAKDYINDAINSKADINQVFQNRLGS